MGLVLLVPWMACPVAQACLTLEGLPSAHPAPSIPFVSAAVLCVSDQHSPQPSHQGWFWTCWPWGWWGHPQQSPSAACPQCLHSLQISTMACCSENTSCVEMGMSSSSPKSTCSINPRHCGEQGWFCVPPAPLAVLVAVWLPCSVSWAGCARAVWAALEQAGELWVL